MISPPFIPPTLRRALALAALAGALLAAGAARAETLTLTQCLLETAEHNPLIVRARFGIEQATAQRLTLRARALPTLSVGGIAGELSVEQVGIPTAANRNPPTTRNQTLILLGTEGLYQPIFDAAIPASYRRGTAEVIAAQEDFYTVASEQLHNARTTFYRALYQQQSGAILRESDAVLAANVKAQNQLADAGLVGRAGPLAAQVQRTNFNPGILAATGSYRSNVASLLQIMGRDLGPGARGDDPLSRITLAGSLDQRAISFDSADAARRALERRPDLRGLRALLRVYAEDAQIARAGYYPLIQIYLAGELVPQTFTRPNPNAVRASDQTQTSELRPGIQESWTIIDTGAVRGEVGRLEAVRGEFAVDLQTLERNIPAQLSIVRARLADASAKAATLGANAGTAQNTLNIIQAGVAQGINSQLEFLEAQSGILDTRTGVLAAELELSLAHAEFDRLTGNYLQFVNDSPPAPAASKRPARK